MGLTAEGNGHRCQSHQGSVSVIEPVSLFSVILLVLQELVHGYGDIASQPDGVSSASVIEAVVEPGYEGVAHVFGVELVSVEEDAVGHAEAHGGVVRPHSHLTVTSLYLPIHDSIVDVRKPFLDELIALLPPLHELSACSQRVSNGHAQNSTDSS